MYARGHAEWLPVLDIDPPERQRRLTVLLRLLLLLPHLIVLFLLSVVTLFAAIAAWFAALVLGRLPGWAIAYFYGYIGYLTRVYASLYLLIDSYPPFGFDAPGFPARIDLRPDELNRIAVLFRIILVIPAWIIAGVVTGGWEAVGFFCWLVVLVMGRTPEPLFSSTAAILRYSMRLEAYILMLSSAYPKRLFGDGEPVPPGAPPPAGERTSQTNPLLLGGGARTLLVIFIIVGVIVALGWGNSDDGGSWDSRGAASTVAQGYLPPMSSLHTSGKRSWNSRMTATHAGSPSRTTSGPAAAR